MIKTRAGLIRRLLVLTALVGAGLSCGREITGPDGRLVARGFSFIARFGPNGQANSVASELAPFDRVRVVIRNSANVIVVDRIVSFPASSNEVSLAIDVPLSANTPPTGEPMALALSYINTAGDTVWQGTSPVTVLPSTAGGQTQPPVQVPLGYTGPGSNAAGVRITINADTVVAGEAFAFTAEALDSQLGVITAPIQWIALNPTIAPLSSGTAGSGTSLPSRGTARFVARLLTGQADTVSLLVLPKPSTLQLVSGDAQTGLPGQELDSPIVVRVRATDNLPVEGITVNFEITDGGSLSGDVVEANAALVDQIISDATGLATVRWALGNGLGPRSMTVTSVGLTGSPLSVSATTPNVLLDHHVPFETDANDAVGGVNGLLVGGAAIAGGVLLLDGFTGSVQYPEQLVPSTGAFSISFFARVLGAQADSVAYLVQGVDGGAMLRIGSNALGKFTIASSGFTANTNAISADGNYHHVALVVDSAAGSTQLFVDGILRESFPSALTLPAISAGTLIGRSYSGNDFFAGEMDDLKIYRGALTAAQVTGIFNTGITAPGSLAFDTQPSSVTVGATIAPPITVRVRNALGFLRTDFNGSVTLSLEQNPGGATLGGTLTVNAVAGIATFNSVTLDAVASGYRLRATSSGSLLGVSSTFAVVSAPATQLAFAVSPSSVVAGTAISPAVLVEARNAQNVLVPSFTGPVTIAIGTNPGASTLGGTLTVNAVGGVATFSDLTLSVAGVGYTLNSSTAGLTGATTGAFTVTAASMATQLQFVQQPTSATEDVAFDPVFTVEARNALGALVPTFSGAIELTLSGGTAGAQLIGTRTVNAVGGVASFPGVAIDIPGGGYVVQAGAVGLIVASADPLRVDGQGGAVMVYFVVEPTNTVAGQVISPAVVVQAVTINNVVATGFNGLVTVELQFNPGGFLLSGTRTVNAINGIATFSTLFLNNPSDYSLRTTSVGINIGNSSVFTVTASGPATQLEFSGQPSAVLAGAVVSPAVTVTAKDALGNVAPSFTGPVTIALVNNAGGATLGGTLTANAVAGVATFANLTLNAGGVGYTLGATSAGLSSATSTPFTATVSALTNVWVNASGGNWSTPANWSQGRIPSGTDSVVISLNGTYTVTMDVNFTGFRLVLGGGTGVQTLQASARTIAVADSFVVRPGAVANLSGAQINGAGTLSIEGRVNITSNSVANTPVRVAATGTLEARSSNAGGNTRLIAAVGIVNAGDILLNVIDAAYTTTLEVTTGSVVNESTGRLISTGSIGSRALNAQLVNSGAIVLNHPLTISRAGAAHVNSGTIAVTQNLSVVLSGTSPSFTNIGSITMASGRTLTVTGGALNLSGGTLVGDTATLALSNVALTMTPASARTRFNFSTGTSFTGPYTIPAGDSLRVLNGTLTAPGLTVEGTFVGLGTVTINAPVTTTVGGTLLARSSLVGGGTALTVVNGFENLGTIDLIAFDLGYTTTFTVTSGTLINAAGGRIRSLPGLPGLGGRTLAAQLDNRGLLDLLFPLTLSRASAAHVNNGTIQVATTSALTVTQTGTSPSFTNTGNIVLAGTGNGMTVNAGTASFTGGSVTSPGAAVLLLQGSVSLNMAAANVQTPVNFGTLATMLTPLTVAASDSLMLFGGTIGGAGIDLQGKLITLTNTTISAPLTTTVGSDIEVRGTSLFHTQGLTNNGTIRLTSPAGPFASQLVMTGQTLTNAATGQILVPVGVTSRQITAATVNNLGSINIDGGFTLAGTLDQRNTATVQPTRTATLTTLNLQPGSTTTVGGTLNVTTCNRLGGTISGPGSIPAICLP